MIDQPFTQAQAGDETSRQLTGQSYQSLGDILNVQLQDALDRQKLGQKRSQLVQDFGSTVQGNVNAARDLSQRVQGEAPSTLISSASDLGSSYVTAAQESAQQASNANVLSILSNILDLKSQAASEQLARQKQQAELLDSGNYKVDDAGLLVPLTSDEQDKKNLAGEEAVAEVIKQGGASIIQKGGTQAERYAIAESILNSGGVAEYKKSIPLIELVNEKESSDINTQTELLSLIDQSVNLLADNQTSTATGLLQQLIPGFVAGKQARDIRRSIETITAQYAKLLSGATISDKEIARLKQFLPDKSKTEQQNLEDLQKLSRDIRINQAIFEKGKRFGLTANEAYKQFGEEIFKQYGVNNSSEADMSKNSGKIKVRRKSDGQVGTLDSESEFDPKLYERI